jgi:NTE family protein
MNVQIKPDFTISERRLPFECVALVLQGGGALGAYQAGVYEALSEAGIHPHWIAGVSIGAINGAIIAGNPLNSRVDRLREFWTQVTADGSWPFPWRSKVPYRAGRHRAQPCQNQAGLRAIWAASLMEGHRDRTAWLGREDSNLCIPEWELARLSA